MKSHSKWIVRVMCAATLLSALCACSNKAADAERPVLAVSIEPQRQLLEQLAGDHFSIITLMPPGTNPETFDPSPQIKMGLDNSKAYFTVGYLTFEQNLSAALDTTNVDVINTSRDITPIYGTHSAGHSHAQFLPGDDDENEIEADPHTWTSLRNLRSMARVMTATLTNLDAKNAKEYADRLSRVEGHLDSLDNALHSRLDTCSVKSFVVMHPSFSYFARDYGLNQIALTHEDKELSVKNLASVIDSIQSAGTKVFFYQSDMDSRHARTIANSANVKLVEINPTAYDWESQMILLVDELTK